MREIDGRFKKGHKKIGGFHIGSKHSEKAKQKISDSLKGKYQNASRRWRGDTASYAAKHIWINKHYGKADRCENIDCSSILPKRYEWANISGKCLRKRSDYIRLCPSCHRKADLNGGIEKCLVF